MDPVVFIALCFIAIVWLIVIITFMRLLTEIRDNTKLIAEALAPKKQPHTPAAQQFKPTGRY